MTMVLDGGNSSKLANWTKAALVRSASGLSWSKTNTFASVIMRRPLRQPPSVVRPAYRDGISSRSKSPSGGIPLGSFQRETNTLISSANALCSSAVATSKNPGMSDSVSTKSLFNRSTPSTRRLRCWSERRFHKRASSAQLPGSRQP